MTREAGCLQVAENPKLFVHTWQVQKPRTAIDPGGSLLYRCGNHSPEREGAGPRPHNVVLVLYHLQPKESSTRNKFSLVPPKLA